jgi:hypothetical protein
MHHHHFVIAFKVSLGVESPPAHLILQQLLEHCLLTAHVCLHVLAEPVEEALVLFFISTVLQESLMDCVLDPVTLCVGQVVE